MHCTNIFNEKHYWPDLHLMTPLDFTGPLDRPLRRELEKVFLTPGASCDQIDPHILWIFILQAQRKTHTPTCKVSKGMKWAPFLSLAKRNLRDLKPSGVVCGRTAKLHRRLFPLSCLLMAPLVILDHWRFSLFEWITRFVVVEKMWKSCACGRQRPLQTIIWSPAVQESGWILNKFWFWNLTHADPEEPLPPHQKPLFSFSFMSCSSVKHLIGPL